MSFVEISNVVKTYHQVRVLDRVSLSIEKGEFITLLGPSGCGKSTLLRAIAGLNPIDEGRIMVGGRDITHLPPKKRDVGMVFQSYALFPNMTVFENIAFGLKMEKLDKKEIRRAVSEMISLIELEGKENHYPHELSGGQQQRVALARSLVKEPTVLLLDEPLSALDAQIRRTLRNEIRTIQKRLNMTTIFVTHDQEEALAVSDRIYVMNHGTIEQHGTPQEIYTSPRSEFVANFIGNYNVWSREQLLHKPIRGIPDRGELFAVRPEAIHISTEPDRTGAQQGIVAEGFISMATVLGNIMRYEIDVQGLQVTVDTLHRPSVEGLTPGAPVYLFVPESEWKCIERSI
jgi:ABC-type spermidine/putrescine transport systems, ATPase components